MKRRLVLTGMAFCAFCSAWAGGLLTNTNQNVSFLRNPARDASIMIDAAYTNPAGLVFLPDDGFYFSFNNQSAFQKRTITATFAPFAGFGKNAEKRYEGEAKALVIPNLQAAYKKGKWVFSFNGGVVGGGGSVKFDNGLSSFESTVAAAPNYLKQLLLENPGVGDYSLESQLEGTSITYGAQLGATYAISEHFSAYAGFRYNYMDNGYDGYLKNIQLSMAGNMVAPQTVLSIDPKFAGLTPLLADKELNCKQTGSGIAPVIGLDYNWNGLNIGAKYEFKTGIELKNKTTANTTGMTDFDDGVKTPSDIPALLTVGAQYDVIPALTVSAGYHHFFDSDASMANAKQQYIDGGINEYLAGVEYKINDRFLVSCGGQITRTTVNDHFQSDLSYSLNSYSLGFGGAINLTKNIRLNLAYFFTNYENWTKESTDYGRINALTKGIIPATAGTDVFGRTNKAFGIGLDFRF